MTLCESQNLLLLNNDIARKGSLDPLFDIFLCQALIVEEQTINTKAILLLPCLSTHFKHSLP